MASRLVHLKQDCIALVPKKFLRFSSSPHYTLLNDIYDAPEEVCGEKKLFDCPLKKWGQKQFMLPWIQFKEYLVSSAILFVATGLFSTLLENYQDYISMTWKVLKSRNTTGQIFPVILILDATFSHGIEKNDTLKCNFNNFSGMLKYVLLLIKYKTMSPKSCWYY